MTVCVKIEIKYFTIRLYLIYNIFKSISPYRYFFRVGFVAIGQYKQSFSAFRRSYQNCLPLDITTSLYKGRRSDIFVMRSPLLVSSFLVPPYSPPLPSPSFVPASSFIRGAYLRASLQSRFHEITLARPSEITSKWSSAEGCARENRLK